MDGNSEYRVESGTQPEQVKSQMYGKNSELLVRVFGKGRFSDDEMEYWSLEKEKRYQKAYRPHLRLIAGLDGLLKRASERNIPMAIGTAAIPFNVDFVLDQLDIRKYFSAIVSADDVKISKPDPETFLKAAALLNTEPSACIVFEDSPKGAEAARNGGIPCVVLTTMHNRNELPWPDQILAFIKDYTDPLSDLCSKGFFSGKFSQNRTKRPPDQITNPSFSVIRRLVCGLNSLGKPTNMMQDMSVTVLREKIQELENALFMSESNALVSLPTHIVRNTEVDAEGNIWFIIPRPTQVIESFSTEMPARLDFFKKGKDFFVKVSGVATIVWSAAEMKGMNLRKEFSGSFEKDNVVAVKVKVESSEYMEKTPRPVSNPLLNVGSLVYNWLLNPLFNA